MKSEQMINPKVIPRRVVNSGFLLCVFGIALSILVAFYFPFQDTLQGKVKIFVHGMPKIVKSPQIGKIKKYAKHGESLTTGQIFGSVNWDIDKENIQTLKIINDKSYHVLNHVGILELNEYLKNLDLKEFIGFEGHLFSLKAAIDQYLKSVNSPTFHKLNKAFRKNKSQMEAIENQINDVQKWQHQQTLIEQNQLMNDSILHNEGILSERDLENRSKELINDNILDKKLVLDQQEQISKKYDIDLKEAQSEYQHDSEIQNFRKNILLATEQMQVKWNTMMQNHLFYTDHNATIYWNDILNQSEYVNPDVEIARIELNVKQNPIGRMYLNSKRVGEIKKGQTLKIALDQYIQKEFGTILSAVAHIETDVNSSENIVHFNVDFPITTSYGHLIELSNTSVLSGDAHILLNKQNLVQYLRKELKLFQEQFN